MRNKDIIKLLKIQDKNVILDKTSIDHRNNTLDCYVSKKVVPSICPSCKHSTKRIHDHRLQKIKHSPINGFKTTLILKKTRLLCTHCGKKFYMNYNDIVNPKFRCSNQLFNSIISDLQHSSCTFKEVASRNFVSPGVISRYLHFFAYLMQWENVTTLPLHIGIDEFKGNCDNSKYLFHIYDLDTKQTVYILRTKKYSDIVDFFNNITNRNDVKIVTMDLCDSFKNAVKAKLKNAFIIADRFHYTRIVANALDELRLFLWRNAKGDIKTYLKNIKRTLLKSTDSLSQNQIDMINERLSTLFDLYPTLKSCYYLYQDFLKIKNANSYHEKGSLFSKWLSDASSSTVKEFSSAADTLLKWHKEILNSFKYSYTNSSTEGKNNKIKVIKRIAYGFRKLKSLFFRIKIRECY